jgi:glutamate-1-semialdehyde aminotransferase/spore coat polysaccharide biosynthesis protein SpsF (cytidylyltransferase family)
MELKRKVLAIIQARYDSVRFPGKVVKKINNKTILEILIKRLSKSQYITKIIVACSNNHNDKAIISICKKLGVNFFVGSQNDLLDRFYNAAKKYKGVNLLRITADCPLVDPKIVDDVISNFFLKNVDYASNTNPPTFPDGLDVEAFKFSALKEAYINAKLFTEREHVTPFIINNKKFKKFNLKNFIDCSSLRLTLDEKEDFILIEKIIRYFKKNLYFNLNDILNLHKKNKNFFLINSHIKRNEGYILSSGQKMWKRAKNSMPGGTMLFSKNPDLFLPKLWPTYFSKTKGCKVWDLDNIAYDDISFMGVGTNTLGYNHPEIEKRVIKTIKSGTMSTLNSVEEIFLAEKLILLHPWSEMARFTRSGGEANAVAVRIARAASGKDKVAICGYHGWHDWYLSSNINNKNSLDNHLMKNLPIKGVPKNLRNTVFPFEYNNFEQLKKITDNHKIGAIKMEVKRNEDPTNDFLQKVRNLATEKKIILIFDECTSGFRQTFGGLHKLYKVNPDMAIFGKALGNGYAINAIIGKKSIMTHSLSSFISSTFWTERIGPTAALATLEVMEKIKSWEIITTIGKTIKKKWKNLSNSHKIKITIQGLEALPNFYFEPEKNLRYKTLITQEMLKKKILASNSIYCSVEHKEKILIRYFDVLNEIFYKISKIEKGEKNIDEYLNSELCLSGIRNK